MNTTITLPEELGKRMTAVAQSLHMDIDVLAIDALERFLKMLEDEARTRRAVARFKAGEMTSSPGEAIFARYLAEGMFTPEDLAQARADAHEDSEIDAPSEIVG